MSIAGEFMAEELRSQPETWERTLSLSVPETAVPADGERVAVIGCGSSWFASQIYANLRETAGQGETDAFTASEYPFDRSYDRVVAISRSGTTTEVVDALERLRGSVPVTAIVGGADSPIGERSNDVIALDFADERSVVQTRFCTSTIALLRSWAGGAEALGTAVSDAQAVLEGISEDSRSSIPRYSTTRSSMPSSTASSAWAGPGAWPMRPHSSCASPRKPGPSRTRRWSTATDPSRSPHPAA